jgi:hypothetical protein
VTILVRSVFVLLILLSLTTQTIWIRLASPMTDTIDGLAAPLAGLGLRNDGPDQNGLITATTPDCRLPVTVGLLNVNGVDDAVADDMLGASNHAVYVYLGSVDNKSTRVDHYKTWLRATIAAFAGYRMFRAPAHFVVAAVPEECPQLDRLNWTVLSPWK